MRAVRTLAPKAGSSMKLLAMKLMVGTIKGQAAGGESEFCFAGGSLFLGHHQVSTWNQ